MSLLNGSNFTTATVEEDSSQYMLDDLQLAAELGKTLLERNKELEGTVKQQQLLIDDHLLEIEYLNKHNVALREVNESRLGCYENLELSILELERTVHRLTTENSSLKRENKTLTTNAETAESRCEELNRQIEELSKQFRSEKRRNDKIVEEQNKQDEIKRTELLKPKLNTSLPCDVGSYNPLLNQSDQESIFRNAHSSNISSSSMIEQRSDEIDGTQKFNESQNENEEFLRVLDELEGKKRQYLNEQQRVTELEEQLHVIIQENNELQSRLAEAATQEEIKSMHDELSILDEVRRGKMCIRCLRNANDDDMDNKLGDDNFSIAGTEDGDNQSLMSNEMGPKTYHNALSFPAKCMICANTNTAKYLHELPVSIDTLLLELWLQFKKMSIFRWMLKMLQWPAIVIYRMISCPTYDHLNFM